MKCFGQRRTDVWQGFDELQYPLFNQALPCHPLVSAVFALIDPPCVPPSAVQFKLSIPRHLIATRVENITSGMIIIVGR